MTRQNKTAGGPFRSSYYSYKVSTAIVRLAHPSAQVALCSDLDNNGKTKRCKKKATYNLASNNRGASRLPHLPSSVLYSETFSSVTNSSDYPTIQLHDRPPSVLFPSRPFHRTFSSSPDNNANCRYTPISQLLHRRTTEINGSR